MVQEYQNAMTRSREIARQAREGLVGFCMNGVESLMMLGYEEKLDLGTYPTGPYFLEISYRLDDGRACRHFYDIRHHKWQLEVVSLDAVPFSKFSTKELLILASKIEQERARYSTQLSSQV